MSELIDKQDAIDAMCEACVSDGSLCSGSCPTKDAVGAVSPVEPKTGKWIRNDNGTYSCSVCRSWIPEEQHYYARYCLYCGARMKGEEE